MERITGKKDDLNQKIRPGTTWVSGFTQPGNNDDIRAIDSDGAELRVIPQSRYYASCKIKRGQALSIAQLTDLTEEQKNNKYAYVKITDPDIDETCLGIAMNYAEEGQIVHIQSTGKFNFITTDSILYDEQAAEEEIFLSKENWSFDTVRGQKLFVKKLYNSTPVADSETTEAGSQGTADAFDTDHIDFQKDADTANWFTYDFAESIYSTKNTIQIGTLTDAPISSKTLFYKNGEDWYETTNKSKVQNKDFVIVKKVDNVIVTAEAVKLSSTGITIAADSTPPKAHEATWLQQIKEEAGIIYYAPVDDFIVTIELDITGDTRGPIDNTQFLLTLGESISFDTKKQDVELAVPDFNQGVKDEIKVVALAAGHPTGPCFRFFVSDAGTAEKGIYVKATEYKDGIQYYKKLPGDIYEKVENLTLAQFNNTYVEATAYVEGTVYYRLNAGVYEKIPADETTAKNLEFLDSLPYYYKQDYYTLSDTLDYAFIGLRKVDGDTYLIPVLCDFTLEDLAGGAALADANDEGYIRLSENMTVGVAEKSFIENGEEVIRSPKITVGAPLTEITRDALKESISTAMQAIFVDNETRVVGCTPKTYDLGDDGFTFLTEEVGGSYDIYVSSNLLTSISCTRLKQGQSAEPGTAILADIRDAERLNVVGIVLSNSTGIHEKGEVIKVLKMGRMVTLGNLLTGQEYFLDTNGRITARVNYWYDNSVSIGTAESTNYFIVNVDTHPRKSYAGNFPLGYLKPSIYGMAEKGFALADGVTVYNKDEYPELYNMLLNWFDPEELKPSNVTEDKYNRYENWTLSQIFTDIFNKLNLITDINKNLDIINTWISKIQSLQQAALELEEKDEAFAAVDESLQNQITANAEAIEDYKTSNDAALAEVKTLAETNQSSIKELVENTIPELQIKVIDIENTVIPTAVASLEEADSILTESLNSATSKIEANTSAIEVINVTTIPEIRTSYEAADTELSKRLEVIEAIDVSNKLAAINNTDVEQNTRISNLEASTDKLNSIVLDTYVDGETKTGLQTRVSKLEAANSSIENTITSLTEGVQDNASDINSNKAAIAEIETSITSAENSLEETNTTLKTLETNVTGLEVKIADLTTTGNTMNEKIDALELNMKGLTEKLNSLLTTVDDILAKLEAGETGQSEE